MQTAPLCSSRGHSPLATSLSPHRVPPKSWPWPRGLVSAHGVPEALLFHLQPVLTGGATGRRNTQHVGGTGLVTLLQQTCKGHGHIFHGFCCLNSIRCWELLSNFLPTLNMSVRKLQTHRERRGVFIPVDQLCLL